MTQIQISPAATFPICEIRMNPLESVFNSPFTDLN